MKYIHELRIGSPKCGKTVSVVGTYPKPMLVFLFDPGGLDTIPSTAPAKPDPSRLTLDITYRDITFIKPVEFAAYCKTPQSELPPVLAVDFTESAKKLMMEAFTPQINPRTYDDFYRCTNLLVTDGAPWKTFVLDSITSLRDALLSFVAAKQASWLTDPRKWSPAVGGKLLQHIAVLCNLDLHSVFLAHSHMEKDETTGAITILPLGPGGFAEQVGGIVSQYIYQTNETGKLEVYTRPKGSVRHIGCRWPSDLPAICGADFKSIYGKEL